MDNEYLTVKEFAAAAGVTTQYIYKILGTHLKPYKKKQNKITVIDKAAIKLVKEGFATDETAATNEMQPHENSVANQKQPTDNQTNETPCNNDNGEIEALKLLIEELKAEKEELKKDKEQLIKDKEYLQQDIVAWKSLLADERNKVKLLEDAKKEDENIIVDAEQPKKKFKWFFNSK